MKKRSAIVLAAGVALALVMGLTAFSLGFSSPPTAADATSRHARKQDKAKPIVKVRHRTITVHKKADPSSSQPQVVQVAGSSGSATAASASRIGSSGGTASSGGYEGEDSYEHESEDSGSYEHESEDPGSHSGGDEESGDD